MTEENFKVLLPVEGGRRKRGRIVFHDCEMTARVWYENDRGKWVCVESSGMTQSALMGMWLWTLWYFRNFCMSILWKVVSYNDSRNSFKDMRRSLKLYCMGPILMLLHLNICFIIVQTWCINIQNIQSWVLNAIHISSYFVLHLLYIYINNLRKWQKLQTRLWILVLAKRKGLHAGCPLSVKALWENKQCIHSY